METQDITAVIAWLRTHHAPQVEEFLLHVALKGAALTLDALLRDGVDDPEWNDYFNIVAQALEERLLTQTLLRAIEAVEETG